VAKPDLGSKHTCPSCSTKFYDLMKSPIVCPKCDTELVTEATAEPAAAAAPVVEPESVETEKAAEAAGVEIVSLDDAENQNDDDSDETAGIEDIEIDDSDDESLGDEEENEPFLETDDDEETDVSGLLGGGISKDGEES